MGITYKIKKAKIVHESFLEAEYTISEKNGDNSVSSTINLSSNKIIHNDLKEAFNKLTAHLGMLTELVSDALVDRDDFYSDGSFETLEVRSFSIGGEDEHEGVTISGFKKLRGKRILNLNTPFTKFDPEKDTSGYLFLHELYYDVQQCINEVVLYIQGKQAPDPQLKLFSEEEV